MQKLTIVRGIPGSGKSTLAEKISKETGAVVVSTDDFFMVNGEYKFDYKYISPAHKWCFGVVALQLFNGKSVVVANTFTQKWEMEPFVDMAKNLGVSWEIVEPTTKWKMNAEECTKKNVHNVPQVSIEKMIARYEKLNDILKDFEKYKV